jgi:hypothetical protein
MCFRAVCGDNRWSGYLGANEPIRSAVSLEYIAYQRIGSSPALRRLRTANGEVHLHTAGDSGGVGIRCRIVALAAIEDIGAHAESVGKNVVTGTADERVLRQIPDQNVVEASSDGVLDPQQGVGPARALGPPVHEIDAHAGGGIVIGYNVRARAASR